MVLLAALRFALQRCGRGPRVTLGRRARRRAAALAFSRSSSELVLKWRLRLCSRRMRDLSMLILKRRNIWSMNSPSRGSTCISGPPPSRMLAVLRPARGLLDGTRAARQAMARRRIRDRCRRAAAADRGQAPRAVGRRRCWQPARGAHSRQLRLYLPRGTWAPPYAIPVGAVVGVPLSTTYRLRPPERPP